MAANPQAKSPFRLSEESILLLEEYLRMILSFHNRQKVELHEKLTAIDTAYARYRVAQTTDSNGDDTRASEETLTGVTEKDVTLPILISQVDSFVGYLADVYLSGYPMFPVVSEPADMKEAEKLEAIIDTHTVLGRYPQHMLMSFRDAIKYNFMPIEVDWAPVDQFSLVSDLLNPQQAAQLKKNSNNITTFKRLNPYNFVWDSRVDPTALACDGEFAGYLELTPRIPLKRFINRHSASGDLYNVGAIGQLGSPNSFTYTDMPEISDYTKGRRKSTIEVDWVAYLQGIAQRKGVKRTLLSGIYERFTCYVRIIPSEFKIYNAPAPNSPQIWKFIMINGTKILHAKPVYTVYDTLPISIGQPLEDGFAMQTQSIGESQIPMQDAASTLFNIRFNAARRAVSDRALYDPTLINASDVNTRQPAPKIPVRLSGLNDKTFEHAYKQIPYDARGTDSVIQDVRNVLDFSDQLSGLNKPNRGQFQKGNKSVQEWQDTMGGADNRLRLPALAIEFQTMIPFKEQIKLNIFQHGVSGNFQNMRTGTMYAVKPDDMEKLKAKIFSFRIADGYTPKAKLASTEFIGTLLQMISSSEILAQSYGAHLPSMVAHLAQLGGVRGLDQYIPQQPQQQPANGQNLPNGQQPPAAPV